MTRYTKTGRTFSQLESIALFDLESDGGLGIKVAPQLLEARIRAAGQMACPGIDGPRWMTFREAQSCYRHLPNKAEEEWVRTVEALEDLDLNDVFPERERHQVWGQRSLCGSQGELGLSRATGSRTKLDEEALRELRLAIEQGVKARRNGMPANSHKDWEGVIRRTFQGVVGPKAEEWALGGADVQAESEGGRLFFDSGEDIKVCGGEATWMKEQEVDQEGYLTGWRRRAEQMREGFSFDSMGYLCHTSCGRIRQGDLRKLTPAVQMVARARLALGDVDVLEGDGKKRDETHVQLRSQYKMWAKITTWAARMRPGCTRWTARGER